MPTPRIDAALALCRRLTAEVPLPGAGATRRRWEVLSTLAEHDLTLARVVEAHLDAVAVLAEAGQQPPPGSTWGVFAAEAPDAQLLATPGPDGGWRLEGTKPWCSLAGVLDQALVTARTDAGRRLFAVDLVAARDGRAGRAEVPAGRWHSRGLVDVPSGPLVLHDVPARPVGEAGWYLRRPGFAHGGIGVAACWFGGAVGVAAPLLAPGRTDPLTLRSRGLVDLRLWSARLGLDAAAEAVDAGRATGAEGELLAARVRALVAATVEDVLTEVGHALGPRPLTADAAHAARVADLTVYVRQHHADHDLVALAELSARTAP
ncbi:acyl-CoA dehydrogenase [Kineococcus sp. LSe6-4]|uniref:Acyl-CoA dehydrogenase n=1 Tax=Kineococcus halophytocola TaxID=3234027 RepID=A0ABV4H4A2_9ACTN